jgi:hypothetical protein
MQKNDNYTETKEGWTRREDAPQVQRSRINWTEYVTPERVEQMERWRKEIEQERQDRNRNK